MKLRLAWISMVTSLVTLAGSGPLLAQDRASQRHASPVSLVHVQIPDGFFNQLALSAELRELQLDIVSHNQTGEVLEIVADAQDLKILDDHRIPYEVAVPDLISFYQSRFDPLLGSSSTYGTWLSPVFGTGSMGGYYTLSEVESVLDQINTQYPSLTTARFSIGQSIQGNDIWAMKISDNPGTDESEPEARFDSLHHAREPEGMQATLWFMLFLLEEYGSDPLATYLVDEREMWFVPVVNPDGYLYNQSTNPGGGGLWRKNRRNNGGSTGVDLNRNYPYQWGFDDLGSSPSGGSETYRGTGAASEPEVSAMTSFMASRNFATALSTHTYGGYWLYPWGYDLLNPGNDADYVEVSELATETNGYLYGPGSIVLYLANGVTFDHDHGTHGTMGWTPEIGLSSDGFWPASSRIVPLAQDNLRGFQVTALAAGANVRVLSETISDLGDADGNFEAGETVGFAVTVRNSGSGSTGTSVTAHVETTSGDLTVAPGNHDFGVLAGFSQANNNGSPLQATIGGGVSAGTAIPFTIVVEYEGFEQEFPGSITVGQARPFLMDNMETNLGWTMGIPSDTAGTGLWEYGDPIGTTSSGQPVNPEDDATTGFGTQCFMTGNGGGTGGTDDVDGGVTTLISPRFDLSGVGAAELSFSRWFALFSQLDDTFEISISNDDGNSWVSLESVSTSQNSWTNVTFPVTDYVAQTDEMRLRFIASDDPNNSLVEAAVDDLQIDVFDDEVKINLYGNNQLGTSFASHVSGAPGDFFLLYASGAPANLQVSGFGNTLLIDPAFWVLVYSGTVPATGLHRTVLTIPNDNNLLNVTAYLQAIVFSGPSSYFSNRDELLVQ